LEPRRLLAAVSWDGGAGTLLWTDPLNWSSDVLPTAADDVTIDVLAAITVTLSSGTQTINSFVSAENLSITNGTLAIAAASTLNGTFAISGAGQLAGDGSLTLNANATFNGGTLAGNGLLQIASTSTVTVTGSNTTVIRDIDNNGAFNMSSGGDLGFAGATFTNDGTLTLSGSGADFSNNGDVNALINNGTITKNGATTSTLRIPVTNNGTITQNAGTLVLNPTGGGTSLANSGAMTVASGATLQIGSLISGPASSLGGGGIVQFITGGTSTLEPGRFSTTGDLMFSGGTVTVNVARTQTANTAIAGTVTFNQPATFNGTATVTGTAAFNGAASFASTLGVTGTATFSSTGTFGGNVTVSGRLNVDTVSPGVSIGNLSLSGVVGGSGLLVVTGTITNASGSMTMDGSGTTRLASTGTLTAGNTFNLKRIFDNEGVITIGSGNQDITFNNGTLINDNQINSENGTSLDQLFDGGGTNLLINNGSINKTLGVASSNLSIEIPIQHNGLINVGIGSISLSGEGSVYSASSNTSGAGNIVFNGGSHTFLGANTLNGIGATGFPFFTGGTATFNVDTTVNNGRFGGSTVAGAGTLSLGNGTTVNGGTFAATGGRLRVPAGTTAAFNGNNPVVARPFDIFGTLQMPTGGDMNVLDTVITVEVGGTLHFNTNAGGSDIEYASGATSGSVVNFGTVLRDGGGSATIRVRFDNRALVDTNLGTLNISGGFADGTYTRTTGVYDVATSTLSFGTVNTNGAEIIARAGAAINGMSNLQYNDGKLDLRDGIDWTFDPFAAQGNTMYNRGQIELSPGSVFTVAPGNHLFFAGTGNATVRSEIAGPTDAEFGRLVVGGQLRLASPDGGDSQFDPDLVGGYDPAAGTRFNIVTAGSVVDGFDNYFGATTPSGLILLAGRTAAQVYAEVATGTPPPAPQILSGAFEFETREAVVITFNTDVSAFISRKDLEITNLTTSTTVSSDIGSLTYDSASRTATITFTNLLPNADYRLSILADDIANSAGVTLTTPLSINFHVLRGDINRDRAVDFDDLLLLAQNYGQTGRTFSQGNIDYSANGLVDFDDLLLLAQRYGTSLSTPTGAPVRAAKKTPRGDVLGRGEISVL
jgi:hypothetical protein